MALGWPKGPPAPKFNAQRSASNLGSGDLLGYPGSRVQGPPPALSAPGLSKSYVSEIVATSTFRTTLNSRICSKHGLQTSRSPLAPGRTLNALRTAEALNLRGCAEVRKRALDGPMDSQSPDLPRSALFKLWAWLSSTPCWIQDPGTISRTPHLGPRAP
jgi:hypothetical protein